MKADDIYEIFKTLSDPTRLKIVAHLIDGEMCACELLENFHISQPTLSYHIKLLENAKLIKTRKEGKWSFYTIDTERFYETANYITSIANMSKENNKKA